MPPAASASRRSPERAAGTALVIGSYQAPGLTTVRTLAAAGYEVIVGDGGEYSNARLSRYCSEVWSHPPYSAGEAFISALGAFLEQRPDVTVIMPVFEPYLVVLSEHRHRLPDTVVLAAPDAELVRTCLDKQRMYDIAAELGVPVQPLGLARELDDLAALADDIGYPCVIKPSGTSGRGLLERKALVCHDRAGLERAFPTWPEGHDALLVQRYAPGALHSIHFIARHGELLATYENRGVRHETLDRTGQIVEWLTTTASPERLEHLSALLDRLDYTGVGCAQFLVPPRGHLHFLEVNPRHGSAFGMAEAAGMPLTRAAIELATGDFEWPEAAVFRYRAGRRVVWTSWDLYSLGNAIASREVSGRSALRWFAQATRAALRADMHLTWSWRDPLPTIAVYARLLTLAPWRRQRQRDVAAQKAAT